ncbi:MAG: hypothetical protein HYX21_00940 [Candidatus Yanofskybacteria bacterium]|nr:hypothetical protein [Candidatus Yanofskybacteria bacterium]
MFTRMPPPMDLLLLSGSVLDSPWPKRIRDNLGIIQKAEMRRKLYTDFQGIFKRIPEVKMDISEAIGSGLIDQTNVARIYDNLTEFLLSDIDHARLILYLPFELLPNRKLSIFCSGPLSLASDKFIEAYILSWRELLNESDFRADYVDGDILEYELDEVVLPHVRKAAHLIPQMIKKNLVSVADVLEILEKTNDEVLVYSILDTFPTLTDLGLVSETEWRRLFNSDNPIFDKTVLAQYQNLKSNPPRSEAEIANAVFGGKISSEQMKTLTESLRVDLSRISLDCIRGEIKTAPKSRIDWLRKERQSKCLEEYGILLAESLLNNKIKAKDITVLLKKENSEELRIACITAVRIATERLTKCNKERAETIKTYFEPYFLALWQKGSTKIKDQLFILWSHWLAIDFIDYQYIEEKSGLKMPQLDSFATEQFLISQDLDELGPVLEDFYSQPEAGALFYPVFIFFGSRLKGYSLNFDSDLDLAVFIRPDTPQSEESKIRSLLEKVGSHPKIRGRVTEFWLDKIGGHLEIKSSPMTDALIKDARVDNSWAHLLLCGMWCGQPESIRELYEKLLPNFLFSAGQSIKGHRAKKIWLRMIESEVLQYRLMHKGYQRFYPREDWRITEHSWPMDPHSTFWDPGYRRVASKLFVARVFLPELK